VIRFERQGPQPGPLWNTRSIAFRINSSLTRAVLGVCTDVRSSARGLACMTEQKSYKLRLTDSSTLVEAKGIKLDENSQIGTDAIELISIMLMLTCKRPLDWKTCKVSVLDNYGTPIFDGGLDRVFLNEKKLLQQTSRFWDN
jgi:hypothetical protein